MKQKDINISEHESKDMELFNSIAKKYCDKDIQEQSAVARKYRLISSLNKAPLRKNARILEVGCGAGFSLKYLDLDFEEYVGVDYSKALIDYAKQFNLSDKASFICANIKDYNPDKKFDVIFMIGVLHHFENMDEILSHLIDLLHPGGIIIANEPQSSNLLIQALRGVRGIIDRGYSTDQIQFSPEKLERLFMQNRLTNVQTFPQGIFSTPFAEVIAKPKIITFPLAKFAVGLDDLFEKKLPNFIKLISWNLVVVGTKQL